jgi:hypothetical protein
MNWQETAALAIVAVTAAAFLWKRFRRPKFDFKRDTHCGCASSSASEQQKSSVVYRARKGHRPEVVVRMK